MQYKNHLDGYNQLDYLTGKSPDSARNELLLTVTDVAHMLSVSEKTLEAWRARARIRP